MSKKFDYVLGQNQYDCGISSVMTILMYYGIRTSREQIISKYKKSDNGYTAYDLLCIAKSYGLDGYGIKSSIKNINTFPVIAHTIKDKNMFHFIVILEKKKNMLKIMDPSEGIKTLSFDEFNELTTNIFLVFSGKKGKTKSDQRFRKEIIRIFQNNKRIIYKTILLSILCIFLSLVFNYYLKLMLSYHDNNEILLTLFIIFLQIVILKNFLSFFKSKLLYYVSKKIDKDITQNVTTHIFNLPYEYFTTKTTGELVTIIEDIEYFKEVITKIFISSLVDIVLVVVIILYLFFIEPLIALVFILMIILLLLITKRFQYVFNDNYIPLKRSKINYSSSLIDYFISFQSIKNLFIHKSVTNILNSNYSKVLHYDKKYNNSIFNYGLVESLIFDLFYLLIIFISIVFSNNSIDIYNVVLFSSVFYLIVGTLNNVTDNFLMLKVYNTSIDRVLDCIDVKPEIFGETSLSTINNICFNDVCYKRDDLNILSGVSFKVEKTDRVFISGESGIGKSTLIKLLLRFFTPTEGNVLIDDIDIKDLDLTFLRTNITYISQNESLFLGSILDNFKLISDSMEKIDKVSSITLLDDFLLKNKIDYNFLIEESANNISGGEKKKIILARGLLHFKEVLILDEVFNEISVKEERKILNNIFNEYKDKIVIVISHRNNNIDLFNKRYKIEGDGKLYEIK